MDDLLKEAIADAKAVRETALENAKMALEEAFTPRLQNMLSQKIQNEIEDEDDEKKDEAMDDEDDIDDEEVRPATSRRPRHAGHAHAGHAHAQRAHAHAARTPRRARAGCASHTARPRDR